MREHSTPDRTRHTFEEHTGELRIRIDAPTLPELFEEAGRALSEAMGAHRREGAPVSKKIQVDSADREALLVDWLNELIFLSEAGKMYLREFEVELPSDRHLMATVSGVKAARLRNPVKAATFHGLTIVRRPGGFTARVVLDV
jgi:SHS2 domain-containing protein